MESVLRRLSWEKVGVRLGSKPRGASLAAASVLVSPIPALLGIEIVATSQPRGGMSPLLRILLAVVLVFMSVGWYLLFRRLAAMGVYRSEQFLVISLLRHRYIHLDDIFDVSFSRSLRDPYQILLTMRDGTIVNLHSGLFAGFSTESREIVSKQVAEEFCAMSSL